MSSKKTKKAKKKVIRDNGNKKVTVFFFHGDIGELGAQLSKAMEDAVGGPAGMAAILQQVTAATRGKVEFETNEAPN